MKFSTACEAFPLESKCLAKDTLLLFSPDYYETLLCFILPSSAHLKVWNKQKILLLYRLLYKLEHVFPIFSKYICHPDKYIRNAQLHRFSEVLPEASAWMFLLYLKNNENIRKTSVSMPVERYWKLKMFKRKILLSKHSVVQAANRFCGYFRSQKL